MSMKLSGPGPVDAKIRSNVRLGTWIEGSERVAAGVISARNVSVSSILPWVCKTKASPRPI